ncbi:MAG: tetratricopeptide repeat protein [Pyrinomonadaceae bacterium]
MKSLHMVIYEPVPPLADLNPSAPAELQRIVRRCLAKDPDERYQSIKEVAIELKGLRREMEGAGIDTTVSPATTSETTGTAKAEATRSRSYSGETSTPSSSLSTRASSAEYVVTGIKQHRLAAGIVVLLVIAGGVGLGLLLHARNASVAIESIAVLPFENKSNDADTEYLADGLAESLIYRLSQLPNLKVSPTSSVMRYKGKATDVKTIAGELGVSAVLTGRIAQRGDNLTISVELVDVRNNKLIWGEQYDRKMSELLTTQRQIAAEITNKLQLKLSGADEKGLTKRYTNNNEAYQLYLKGRFYQNKSGEENLRKAIEQFKAAAEKDPNYALAFVGLADSYASLTFLKPSNELAAEAKAFALRALEMDDSLGEAHTSLGIVNMSIWNWAEAEKEFKRGIELNPNYSTAHQRYGGYLRTLGRFDEALTELKRAQELEPLSLIISLNLVDVHFQKGDFDAAIEQCRKLIDLDPGWYYGHQLLGLVYVTQGRNAEALAAAEKAVELSNRQTSPLGVLGYIYAQTGKRTEAAAIIEELKERYAKRQANGWVIARVYVGLGDKEQVFAWLEKDFQSRSSALPSVLNQIPFNSLRDDPRFKDLAKRMKMPDLK